MEAPVSLEQHLRQLEEELLQPTTRQNPERLDELLAEDFREFGSSGRVHSRGDIIEALQSESQTSITLSNFQSKQLSEEIVLVTYTASRASGSVVTHNSLRSSVWINRTGHWQLLFHQGTRVPT